MNPSKKQVIDSETPATRLYVVMERQVEVLNRRSQDGPVGVTIDSFLELLMQKIKFVWGETVDGPLSQDQLERRVRSACQLMLSEINEANLEADYPVTFEDVLDVFTDTEFIFDEAAGRRRTDS